MAEGGDVVQQGQAMDAPRKRVVLVRDAPRKRALLAEELALEGQRDLLC